MFDSIESITEAAKCAEYERRIIGVCALKSPLKGKRELFQFINGRQERIARAVDAMIIRGELIETRIHRERRIEIAP
jgi:hypothetical protein